ncbi:MAG: PAS domain-containing protein [Brevinemataceae bacterium]
MYVSLLLMIRLFVLSICYFFVLVVFWKDFGAWILLAGLVPLIFNTVVFSYPLWNFLSTLAFTFMTLFIMNVDMNFIFYEALFWGILSFWGVAVISVVVFKNFYVPIFPIKHYKKSAVFFFNRDNPVLIFNMQGIITEISDSMLRFYGWKRKKILGQSVNIIYTQDIFHTLPELWESLNKGRTWHGFVDVKTQKGLYYMERASYRGILDKNGKLYGVEKKIIEAFAMVSPNNIYEWYEMFFYETSTIMAVVNLNGTVEFVNEAFKKNIKVPFQFYESVLSSLFSQESEFIEQTFQETLLSRKKTSCIISGKNLNFTNPLELIFVPYFSKNSTHDLVKILVMIQPAEMPELFANTTFIPYLEEPNQREIFVKSILKDALTRIYDEFENPLIKLMSGSLPAIKNGSEKWFDLFYGLFVFLLKEHPESLNEIIVTSSEAAGKHKVQIYCRGSDYENILPKFYNNSFDNDAVLIKEQLAMISDHFQIIGKNSNDMIINFEFKIS